MYLGIAAYYSKKICDDPVLTKQVATLLQDARWPWPFTSVVFGQRAGWNKHKRRQKLASKGGLEILVTGMADPEGRDLTLDHRANSEENHCRLNVETGQRVVDPDAANPTKLTGLVKKTAPPGGDEHQLWTELMHQLMICLDVANGVLPVWPTENMVDADTIFVNVVLDAPQASYNLGIRERFQAQNARVKYWRSELGGRYIRHPRWGNYIRRAHLDLVGGINRIRDTVPLAKVLELGGAGDLIYLQCTEHPEGALTVEGEGIRHALEQALAPIVAPPRPQEQAAT